MNNFDYTSLAVVFCGGGIGAVLRFLVGNLIVSCANSLFPLGIFVVNITGCFAIGFLVTFFIHEFTWSNNWRWFFVTGILGGYTTFSSFSLDVVNMLQNQQILFAIFYVTITLIGCLTATWLGVLCGKI